MLELRGNLKNLTRAEAVAMSLHRSRRDWKWLNDRCLLKGAGVAAHVLESVARGVDHFLNYCGGKSRLRKQTDVFS